MSDPCGCDPPVSDHAEGNARWRHDPSVAPARRARIEEDILHRNRTFAAENRARIAARGALALNLVSSPGSGKTTLLVRTIQALAARVPVAVPVAVPIAVPVAVPIAVPIAVIEGDPQSSRDADRVRAAGAKAVQINTGKGCHLDAHGVGHALVELGGPPAGGVLVIENVGNLICPADFDLGEHHRIVIVSVTEGDDKPLKYPHIFAGADLVVVSKIDLLPHVDFRVDDCVANARRVNPRLEALALSATTGAGMDAWIDWILARHRAIRAAASDHPT